MSGVDFTLWSAHRQSINEGTRLWVNRRVSQSFTHNSIKEIWCNSHWFCLRLAKDQFVKGKRLVVIELMNMLMSQDTSFQIFGRGGNKHRKDQAWIGWHCPEQEPVVTKWCVIMLSAALARLGTLQGNVATLSRQWPTRSVSCEGCELYSICNYQSRDCSIFDCF